MMLMFQLGRPDVLPATDFGVRSGFALTYGYPELPPPKQILAFGEKWRPYRSMASGETGSHLEIVSPLLQSQRTMLDALRDE